MMRHLVAGVSRGQYILKKKKIVRKKIEGSKDT
jgi:hypothetical protein